MIKTDVDEHYGTNKGMTSQIPPGTTDLVPLNQLLKKIESYLQDAPLNIEKDEYCYVKIVGHHLEIGRAKIILED